MQLELILAVDTSLSVSNEEFALQMGGLADAFRSEQVIGAIRGVGDHGIAVTLIQWSDRTQQRAVVDWSLIRDAAGAFAFAERLDRAPRHFDGAGTALAKAVLFAIPLFQNNGLEGDRKVIDVSGDGIDNRGPLPYNARRVAVAAGITINGLAILNEDQYLDLYYAENVIGGSGAFVMTAADYRDFAQAIARKLIREIGEPPVAQGPGPGPATVDSSATRIALSPAVGQTRR